MPYIAIRNQKCLKWKFTRRDKSDWTVDTCSFKIFTTFSKNFESAYYLLNELIDQNSSNKLLDLNHLWTHLIKICCVQSFSKRLKVLSLLIKIIQKVFNGNESKLCINLFDLKPLKNLQYKLEENMLDRNFSRAFYELFFFAEKLAIKWSIQTEYVAKMRDREEFLDKITETSYFIKMIMNSMSINNGDSVPELTKIMKKARDSFANDLQKNRAIQEEDLDVYESGDEEPNDITQEGGPNLYDSDDEDPNKDIDD